MNRWKTFTFRVSPEERNMIFNLARQLQRTQSDAIRWLIREVTQELFNHDTAGNSGKDHTSKNKEFS